MAPSQFEVAVRAAIAGNLSPLKELSRTEDLHRWRGVNGRSMLHFAAAGGLLDLCKYLVEEAGFHANSTSRSGETPILAATEAEEGRGAGGVAVLRYLLHHGGNPAAPGDMGNTPLHNAAEYGNNEAVRLLLSRGVPVDPLNHTGRTPLHLALAKDRDQAVKTLLEHGADPNRVVTQITSPLFVALCGHSLKCMKLLVKAGANVNFKIPPGKPVLFSAVYEGLTDIVKFLLEAGADPNIQDYGMLPIMLAAVCGHRELVEILLPWTKLIPSLPNWSVDGVIRTMEHRPFEPRESDKERLAYAKSKGKEAFAKGDYFVATYYYSMARNKDPLDATIFANRSLCWLRQQDGKLALFDAQRCKMLCPRWAKAWYREDAALSLLKDYKRAVDSFKEALKLDPDSNEIKKALREAIEAMQNSGTI